LANNADRRPDYLKPAAEIQGSGFAPSDPAESAIVATLQPGSYTAFVRGVNANSGVGLVEIYSLP